MGEKHAAERDKSLAVQGAAAVAFCKKRIIRVANRFEPFPRDGSSIQSTPCDVIEIRQVRKPFISNSGLNEVKGDCGINRVDFLLLALLPNGL